jgi:hypothetical protein
MLLVLQVFHVPKHAEVELEGLEGVVMRNAVHFK